MDLYGIFLIPVTKGPSHMVLKLPIKFIYCGNLGFERWGTECRRQEYPMGQNYRYRNVFNDILGTNRERGSVEDLRLLRGE